MIVFTVFTQSLSGYQLLCTIISSSRLATTAAYDMCTELPTTPCNKSNNSIDLMEKLHLCRKILPAL